MNRSLVFIGFTLVALLLVGCGGGDQKSFTGGARSGGATFTIKWPQTSRLIPQATQSIAIRVMKEGQDTPVAERYANRPAEGGTSTVTFDRLPVGTFTAIATAFPQWNAGGTALATGSAPLVTQSGKVTVVTLTMASRVDHLTLLPASPGVAIGHTRQLSVFAQDVDGYYLLLSPSKLTWESLDTAKATVDGNGLVTGVALGTATVRVTDTESTKTASVMVTITEAVVGQDVTLITPTNCQWVAFQDGDSPWQVLGTTPGIYTETVTDPQGRYGIAMVESECVRVVIATTSEITQYRQPISIAGSYSVNGMLLNNIGSTTYAIGTNRAYPDGPGYFSLMWNIMPGIYDLCAVNWGVSPKRMYLNRNLIVDGNLHHDIDFTGISSFDLIGNYRVDGPIEYCYIDFLSANHTRVYLGSSGSTGLTYAALPSDHMIEGDLYQVKVDGSFFKKDIFFATPHDITIVAPEPFSSPTMTLMANDHYPQSSFTWSMYPDAVAYRFCSSDYSTPYWQSLTVSAKRSSELGNAIIFPDFTSLPGWQMNWCITTVDMWVAEALVSNATLQEAFTSKSYELDQQVRDNCLAPQAQDGMINTTVTKREYITPYPLPMQRNTSISELLLRNHSPFF